MVGNGSHVDRFLRGVGFLAEKILDCDKNFGGRSSPVGRWRRFQEERERSTFSSIRFRPPSGGVDLLSSLLRLAHILGYTRRRCL